MAPSKKNRRKKRLEESIHAQAQEQEVLAAAASRRRENEKVVSSVKGVDDVGNFYDCHADLVKAQDISRDESYKTNAEWWNDGGYGGDTDDMVMTGDSDGLLDGAEGLAFLDKIMAANNKTPGTRHAVAVDIGAGVGRVTKLILLKRYSEIRLVEGNETFSKRSRVYLGRKRASRCIFTNCFLQDLNKQSVLEWGAPADLIWCQWTLQYLTDTDVVKCLKTLAGGLRAKVGVLIVKENRPFGGAREDRFQMDTARGANGRFDMTRPDAHHRLLFQKASLRVDHVERGVETNTYALSSN